MCSPESPPLPVLKDYTRKIPRGILLNIDSITKFYQLSRGTYAKKEAAPKVPPPDNRLHSDQAEAQNKENCNNGNCDVSLSVLTGEQSDQSVSNAANTNTVGNRIGQRHHDQC